MPSVAAACTLTLVHPKPSLTVEEIEAKISAIFCDLPDHFIRIVDSSSDGETNATTLYLDLDLSGGDSDQFLIFQTWWTVLASFWPLGYTCAWEPETEKK